MAQHRCGPDEAFDLLRRASQRAGVSKILPVTFRTGNPTLSGRAVATDDIAAHLGVTKDTVYLWIAEKGMPAHRVGRLWKFQASEADEWFQSGSAASSGGSTSRSGT